MPSSAPTVIYALSLHDALPIWPVAGAESAKSLCGGGFNSTKTSAAVWARYLDRKSTRLNSSHFSISYAVFCPHSDLRSFPTRRSSDLACRRRGVGEKPLRRRLQLHQDLSRGLGQVFRSEEHTSELQSLQHLVCRLLPPQ